MFTFHGLSLEASSVAFSVVLKQRLFIIVKLLKQTRRFADA